MTAEPTVRWMPTRLPVAAFVKPTCADPGHDVHFGPRGGGAGDESATGILATAGASLIVDGVGAVLASAASGREDKSIVDTSFMLTVDSSPRCFELQRSRPDGKLAYGVELGLLQGGITKEGKYFRLVPTQLTFTSATKSRYFGALDGDTRALGVLVEFSKPDGSETQSFTINFGEWKAGKGSTDVPLNAAALRPGADLRHGAFELAGPWFTLKGSQAGERPYNAKFTLIETKSANALAKMVGDQLTAQKDDITKQLTTVFTPTPEPTPTEREAELDAANTAISQFCNRFRPLVVAAGVDRPMTANEVADYNARLATLKDKVEGTTFAGSVSLLPELGGNPDSGFQINAPGQAAGILAQFDRVCAPAPKAEGG